MSAPADPLLSQALIESRGGVVTTPLELEFTPSLVPRIDDASAMALWEPLVRFNVLMLELSSRVRFDATKLEAALSHVEVTPSGAGGAWTAQVKPLVRMTRPDYTPAAVNAFFKSQLVDLLNAASDRETRRAEIVTQMAPQTPFWAAVANIQPHRHRHTLELLAVTLAFASSAAMRFKHALALPRPAQFSAKVQPLVPTPEHSTLPSGHATEAFAAAYVLGGLLKVAGHPGADSVFKQLVRLAERIAYNRTVAGLHFNADSVAGRMLGATLAEYVVHRCVAGASGLPAPPTLPSAPPVNQPNGSGWQAGAFVADANGHHPFPRSDLGKTGPALQDGQAPSAALGWLWDQAKGEWQ